MGVIALTDAYAYVAGHDFTTDTNNATLNTDVEALDATTFGSNGWKEFRGGLKAGAFDMAGFWQSAASDSVDTESFPQLGVVDQVYTVGPLEVTPANPLSGLNGPFAYMFRAGKFRYEPFGPVGQLIPFKLGSMGTNGQGIKRGWLLKPRGDVSATGALGATLDTIGFGVGAGLFLWVTFHVFVAGTTITVQVQSDDNVGFATPTTIATIGPLTTTGGTWMTPVPGPLTDSFYRLNVSAITGTFNVAAALAIAA